MTPLHAPAVVTTRADMHVEPRHLRPYDRQIFLNLCDDAGLPQTTAAVGTRGPRRDSRCALQSWAAPPDGRHARAAERRGAGRCGGAVSVPFEKGTA